MEIVVESPVGRVIGKIRTGLVFLFPKISYGVAIFMFA